MYRALIVEDDLAISCLERDYLSLSDFDVDVCNDGLKGYNRALSNSYDVIILDVMLPNMNGYDICMRLRDKIKAPIIFVSAKNSEIDIIRGLGIGAIDYIEKPFSPSILVAKVKSKLKQIDRFKGNNDFNIINIDNIKIDTLLHKVYKNEIEVILKNKEYELLLFLVKNKNHVFSHDEIYESVWGLDSEGDNRTVAVHINRLRDKLEDDSNNPKYLCTMWGAGYYFNSL